MKTKILILNLMILTTKIQKKTKKHLEKKTTLHLLSEDPMIHSGETIEDLTLRTTSPREE
jgi:hypothetical protein